MTVCTSIFWNTNPELLIVGRNEDYVVPVTGEAGSGYSYATPKHLAIADAQTPPSPRSRTAT